jgi:hypothetical protein
MTEPRRTVWSILADEWDPDHPAVRRGRDILRPSEPVQDALRRPEPLPAESEPTPEPVTAPEESMRGRIADLVARVQAGDLSAVDMLRRLIDR